MNAQRPEVVVVGNAGMDLNVYLHTGRLDLEREAHFTRNVENVGQAGGYASRSYAALGRKTAYFGAFGRDSAGQLVKDVLQAAGVDLSAVFEDPEGTARSVNLVYPDGRRNCFYDGRSHVTLEAPLDKFDEIVQGARLAHFNLANWSRKLLAPAAQHGLLIATDLQDLASLEDPYRRDFIEGSKILFCSSVNLPDVYAAAMALRGESGRLVIIGMGERGCAMAGPEGFEHFASHSGSGPVVDTNGAGDALAATFLTYHVLEGRPRQEALALALRAARFACEQRAPKALISKVQLESQ